MSWPNPTPMYVHHIGGPPATMALAKIVNQRKTEMDPRIEGAGDLGGVDIEVAGIMQRLRVQRLERVVQGAHDVQIDGDLHVALSWSPTVTIDGLRIGNADWVRTPAEMARVERLRVTFQLLPVFYGRLILPAVVMEKPVVSLTRQADGAANWDFGGGDAQPMQLPVVNALRIEDGHLTVDDRQRKLVADFIAGVGASEQVNAEQVGAGQDSN